MKSSAASYAELRDFIGGTPLVDCHDHSAACGPKYLDATQVVTGGYYSHDLMSATSPAEFEIVNDITLPLEKRWPLLEKMWKRACHTGYARVTRLVLKEFFGEDDVTLESLRRIQEQLPDYEDEKLFDQVLEKALISARLLDVFTTREILSGELTPTPRGYFVIGLPGFHAVGSYESVQEVGAIVGKTITSLDEYLDTCREIFDKLKAKGCVAFKDQSAYQRPIDYGNPTRAEAEKVFNWFMEDPRRRLQYPDGSRPLGDFLFHEFMRMARDLDLPVQIHTGHMAGIRNDIAKTNAIGLTRVLELHREVRFDLFHANWPFGDEFLFLGKNYPNVSLDFCWANIIDPIYCQNLFKQALSSVPHCKIHAYGSDFVGFPDRAWAHAEIARDNIAIALADMVEMDYLSVEDAKETARAWMFDNPNSFFKLGL